MQTTVAIAVAALTLSVAACGQDGASERSAGAPAAAEVTGAQDVAAEVTGAGDRLALGQRAVVPFVDYGAREQPTKVGVRVLDVRKGDIADLKAFDLDRRQRRSVPYYVDARFENLWDFALTRNLQAAPGPGLHRLRGVPVAQWHRARPCSLSRRRVQGPAALAAPVIESSQ